MPKVKTHSGAKKRFSLTGSGELRRRQAGKRHCLAKRLKTTKQKRHLTKDTAVHVGDQPRIKSLLNL